MSKPPILFIHGMWSTAHIWRPLADHYAALGHEVMAPTLPHHDTPASSLSAPSELGQTGIDDYAGALAAAVTALAAPPVIVGHSMGGLLAQIVAMRLKAAGLVLLAPAPSSAVAIPSLGPVRTLGRLVTQWGWWRRPLRIDRESARWGFFNNVPSDLAEAELDAMVWDSGRALFQMSLPWLDGRAASRVDYDRLNMPVLLVVGSEDRITPVNIARATARRLDGRVTYRELDGVGHWHFHEPVRSRLLAEIDGWLARSGFSGPVVNPVSAQYPAAQS